MNYNDLLSKIDIVDIISQYAKISKSGNDYKIICPFHEDKDPSLNISIKKQIFKCFVCGVGGNAINFVEKHLKLSYASAANLIAKNFSIKWSHVDDWNNENHKLNEQELKIISANEEALKLFKYNIFDSNNEPLQIFLKQRKITNEIISYFQLGYAIGMDLVEYFKKKTLFSQILLSQIGLLSSNLQSSFFNERLIFPIFNQYKELVGFSGRIIQKNEQLPKYMNSPESKVFLKQKILFNLNNAWESIKEKKEVIICEGFMDVIALHRINCNNVIALMGTNLSDEHLKIFKIGNNKINITLFLDSDIAGISATMKSIYKLISNNFQTFIIKNNTKLDPDEIFIQQGHEILQKFLLQKENAIHFYYEQMILLLDQDLINNFDYFKKIILNFSVILKKCEKDIQSIYITKMSQFFKQDRIIIEEIFKQNNFQKHDKNQNYDSIDFRNKPLKSIDKNIQMRYLTSLYYIIKSYLIHKNIKEIIEISFDFNIYDILLDKIFNNFKAYFDHIKTDFNKEKIDFDQYMLESLINNKEQLIIFSKIQQKYAIEKEKKISVYIAKTSNELLELQTKIKNFYENMNEENWINNIKNQNNKETKEKISQSFLSYYKSKK